MVVGSLYPTTMVMRFRSSEDKIRHKPHNVVQVHPILRQLRLQNKKLIPINHNHFKGYEGTKQKNVVIALNSK